MSVFGVSRPYLFLTLGCLIISSSVQAHHAAAPHYDMGTNTFVEDAVVSDFKMVNPHSFVFFDAIGADNKKANWRCELRSGTVLKRNGWTKETLPKGMKISIKGHPAWREDNHCLVESLIFPDGTEVSKNAVMNDGDANQSRAQVDEGGSAKKPIVNIYGQPVNISGDWVNKNAVRGDIGGGRNALPNNGFDISEAGSAAAKSYNPSFDDPSLHCHPINIIQGFNHDRNVNQITQLEYRVLLTYGFVDFVRTIYLDADHPDPIEPSIGGHSVGTWDSDVLIVDTVGFLPGVIAHRVGVLHSDQLRITEKFHIDEASGQLLRDYTFNDPEYLNAPYSGQDRLTASDIPYTKYNCTDLTGVNSLRPQDVKSVEPMDEPAKRSNWLTKWFKR